MGRTVRDQWDRHELVRIGQLVRGERTLYYSEIGKLYGVSKGAIAGLVERYKLTSKHPNYDGASKYSPEVRARIRQEAGRVARSGDDRWTESRLTQKWKKK